jgi:hypothetical protein
MLGFLRAVIIELFVRFKRALAGRPAGKFSRIRSSNFTIRRKGRDGLIYEEPGRRFLVSAMEGDGYTILVEQMGDADFALDALPVDEKLRIARNIQHALTDRKIDVEVVYQHRVLRV